MANVVTPAGGAGNRRLRLRSVLLAAAITPVIARPGYWFATACAVLWGAALGRGHVTGTNGLIVASRLPHWGYGRGGTTVGAVYLTTDNVARAVLEHEAVHRAQWKRYGLAFIPLYLIAGQDARTNRFEIEAGLEKGGYGR